MQIDPSTAAAPITWRGPRQYATQFASKPLTLMPIDPSKPSGTLALELLSKYGLDVGLPAGGTPPQPSAPPMGWVSAVLAAGQADARTIAKPSPAPSPLIPTISYPGQIVGVTPLSDYLLSRAPGIMPSIGGRPGPPLVPPGPPSVVTPPASGIGHGLGGLVTWVQANPDKANDIAEGLSNEGTLLFEYVKAQYPEITRFDSVLAGLELVPAATGLIKAYHGNNKWLTAWKATVMGSALIDFFSRLGVAMGFVQPAM